MKLKSFLLFVFVILATYQVNAKKHHSDLLLKSDTVQTPVKRKLLVLRQGQLVHKYKQVIDTFEQRLTSISQNLPNPIVHETPQIPDISPAAESDTNQVKKGIKPSTLSSLVPKEQVAKPIGDKSRSTKKSEKKNSEEVEQKNFKTAKALSIGAISAAFIQLVSFALILFGAGLKTNYTTQIQLLGLFGLFLTAILPFFLGLVYFRYKKLIQDTNLKQALLAYDVMAIMAFCLNALSVFLFLILLILAITFIVILLSLLKLI